MEVGFVGKSPFPPPPNHLPQQQPQLRRHTPSNHTTSTETTTELSTSCAVLEPGFAATRDARQPKVWLAFDRSRNSDAAIKRAEWTRGEFQGCTTKTRDTTGGNEKGKEWKSSKGGLPRVRQQLSLRFSGPQRIDELNKLQRQLGNKQSKHGHTIQ